ncbi:hypothetical protein CYMTET_40889 [Cymbomonas tetramitiformis]|uniref:Uncharacterized protein n=1 Tax=Cymbomonas tetramitiformis TaxID=36881 RepID=A0AAE0F371_9CHLO|nr:hypothetical protein CYMTET_40889 [Cymbomonas tetramitiformis]
MQLLSAKVLCPASRFKENVPTREDSLNAVYAKKRSLKQRSHARCRHAGRKNTSITATSTDGSKSPSPTLDSKSADLVDLFERAATPLGAMQRAEAALAVLNAVTAPKDEKPVETTETKAEVVPDGPARLSARKTVRQLPPLESSRNLGGAKLSDALGEKSSDASEGSSSRSSSPGPDFWSWTPPEEQNSPKLAKATQTQTQMAAPTRLMEKGAEAALPPLQSVLDTSAAFTALPFQTSTDDPVISPVMAAPLTTAKEEVVMAAAAVSAGMAEGNVESVRADGTRMWQETGEELKENGRLCRWTLVRGQSADGSVEWEEKWWETSDAWGYRELGAEKSGRKSDGGVWFETWSESLNQDKKSGLSEIVRSANKWSKQADGSEWHEQWNENHKSDGRVEKDAYKRGSLGKGVTPEDGHANNWHERWGESFDGKGGATKWTDRWADRDEAEDGSGRRSWGDKWHDSFGYGKESSGGRGGESWSNHAGNQWNRTWGEEHNGDGEVHKFGQSSDGEHWDTVEHMDTWYESHAHYGWDEAIRQSNELLAVPLRRRDGRGLRKRGVTIQLPEMPERAATQKRAGRGGLRSIEATLPEEEDEA